MATASINGTSNNFPAGQCTQYADDRYHQLTGFYVPFSGNAKDWATNCLAYGWHNSSTPIVPSIICLQGGIQFADSAYGHVGIVESIGSGTVSTTDLNWGVTTAQQQSVQTVTFLAPAPGVSFIYAVDSNGKPAGATSTTLADVIKNVTSGNGSGSPITLSPTADVVTLLGVLDQTLEITNPFDVQNAQQDSILGTNFTDPFSWIEGFGGNLLDDASAIAIRAIFLFFGLVVLYKAINQYVDIGAAVDSAVNGVKTVGMFAAL